MEDWRGGYGLNLSTNENISLVVGSQIFVIGKALKADFFFFFECRICFHCLPSPCLQSEGTWELYGYLCLKMFKINTSIMLSGLLILETLDRLSNLLKII